MTRRIMIRKLTVPTNKCSSICFAWALECESVGVGVLVGGNEETLFVSKVGLEEVAGEVPKEE